MAIAKARRLYFDGRPCVVSRDEIETLGRTYLGAIVETNNDGNDEILCIPAESAADLIRAIAWACRIKVTIKEPQRHA